VDPQARLRAEFDDLATRLHREFDGQATPADVDQAFAAIAGRYQDARVLTFVPVLVERQVRSVLRSSAAAGGI
jgi:hypothetical protein